MDVSKWTTAELCNELLRRCSGRGSCQDTTIKIEYRFAEPFVYTSPSVGPKRSVARYDIRLYNDRTSDK